MLRKYIHDFKAGDIVHFHGARFRILEDAKHSLAHLPEASAIERAHGPSDCAWAPAVCIDGSETRGYIEHGKPWTFQGNRLAGTYPVEKKD